jgi:LPS export ABC transporter permease LptG
VTVFDRYILREWLKILGLIMCATMGLLLVQALYDNFRDLIDLGAETGEIFLYFAASMPSYFSVVLPISLLLSLLFVLSKLHRGNELTAMRSAGLNIFATTRSLWLASIVFCGISLLLNARIVPWSVQASRQLMEGFEYREEAKKAASASSVGLVTGVAFDNHREGRLWYINRYSRFTKTAYGVTVSELDGQRREKWRLMAREGAFNAATNSWTFSDGRETWYDAERGELLRSAVFAKKSMPHYREDPALLLLIDRKPHDLSLFDLQRIVDFFELEANPKVLRYAQRYYAVLAETLAPLIILAIAIPFAVSGVRVSPTVGVSKSIGLFFAYYLLNTLAVNLGGNGFMDPLWAAWLPNTALIGVAAFFFGRMR